MFKTHAALAVVLGYNREHIQGAVAAGKDKLLEEKRQSLADSVEGQSTQSKELSRLTIP